MMNNTLRKSAIFFVLSAFALFALALPFLISKKTAFASNTNKVCAEIVIEQSSRQILYCKNENEKMYPASTTKILTALTVLENADIKSIVEITKEMTGIEGSSIYLKEDEKLTIEDLLYGMMLRSGNDAATALAIAVSGNIEDFANLMNETAKNCGAENSHFVNPHGLHNDEHYVTAYDLALITAKAFENDTFCEIVKTKVKAIGEGESKRVIANKNKMLKMYDGANGVKTGFTKNSGRCLVSSAKRNNMQLVSVVLNCGDMWNESAEILNFGFENYHLIPTELALQNGENVKVSYDENGDILPKYYPVKN